MMQRYFGTDNTHPHLADTYGHLARLATKIGDLQEAERLYKESIRLDSLFYRQSKAVADSTLLLAAVFRRKGVMDEAERLSRECLDILRGDKDVLPDDVAIAIYHLAGVLHENKKTGEAVELFRECLSLLHKCTGTDVQHFVDVA